MAKYKAPSPEFIQAKHHGGEQIPTLIVMHGTVSPCTPGGAVATANFFAKETLPTSAHYVTDPKTPVQCVSDHSVAYHCGYNQNSIGIEMCMNPRTDLQNWLQERYDAPHAHDFRNVRAKWLNKNYRNMLNLTAKLVAELCLAYDIPPRWAGKNRLRLWDLRGKHASDGGITTHALMSRVFKKSSHWDPGLWPRPLFIHKVRKHYKKLK